MLAVEGLHYGYNGKRVLSGFSLAAGEGELVGIVGTNGSGKTTLLRLISGVMRPAAGSITVGGLDLASLKASERSRLVAVVPQNPQLPPGARLIDLVMMGRNPHLKLLQWEGKRDVDVARRVMEMTDTLEMAERSIDTLSGGEKQRGLVAMALAQEAPLLLLDEPTSSLDLAHQASVMDLVRDVQKRRGGTVVVAMHDLTLAAQYCRRIVMLDRGRSFADGNPGEVLTPENIQHVYGVKVEVMSHPQGGTPVVLPLSTGARGW